MMFLTFRTLLRHNDSRDLNWGMIAATCALLLLSTSVCVPPATDCQDLHLIR